METIGLRELRQDASVLVRRAENGEEITVMVSGRPAARLVPAHAATWRTWAQVAELFRGADDPDRDEDRDLADGDVRDPWNEG